MTTTPNLGLSIFDTASGSATTFLTFRLAVAGNSSNMTILDTYLGAVSASVVTLRTNSLTNVAANFVSTNYYESTTTTIGTYDTNMMINLKLNSDITGSTTININSIGIITLKKLDADGLKINLASGDLKKNKYYLFIYDGTNFILMGSSVSDQISVPGTVNRLINISASGILQDSGVSASSIPSTPVSLANGGTGKDNSIVANSFFAGLEAGVTLTHDANTGVGYRALKANTTGYDNTAFGWGTLEKTTDGYDNTGVGTGALGLNVHGISNAAFGTGALQLSKGSQNTALGTAAGGSMSSGSGNVFIGYKAGNAETLSNMLYISNSSSASPVIKGNFSASSLQFGAGIALPIDTKIPTDSPYTIIPSNYTLLAETTSGSIQMILPTAGSILGKIYNIKNIGSGSMLITSVSGLIDNSASQVLYRYDSITVVSGSADWWII